MLSNQLKIKFLSRSHTLLGLFAIFLFYISTYFGSITLFLPYLNSWELPSRHYLNEIKYEHLIDIELNKIVRENKLNPSNIEIQLPSLRDDTIKISSENQNSVYLNPYTKEILDTNNESAIITTLFNKFHTGENIPIIGMKFMGISSIILIFLMISGIYLYILKKRTFKNSVKQNRNFIFKWHKIFGFVLTPYVIIFALTGAFLGFMLSNAAPIAFSATNYEKSNMSSLVRPILFAKKANLEESTLSSKPMQLKDLYQIASQNYPQLDITKINIYNYRLDNSQIMFSGYLKNEKSRSSSRLNPMYIILNSKTAELVEKKELEDSHIMKKTLSAFYWLHFQVDEGLFLRVLFFIFGIIMLVCLFFGYLIWAEKKLKEDRFYFDILNRFSIALMLGIIPSSAFLMIMYWIIPNNTFDRIIWVEGCFYLAWSFYLFYCFKENSIKKILKMIFLSSSILFLSTCFLHEIHLDIFLVELFEMGLLRQFFIDFSLILLGIFFYILYKKVDKVQYFEKFEKEVI